MDTDTSKLKTRLTALNGALDDLEHELEPLFAQTLPESVVGLDTIQQAQLQVAIPYLVYDLVFIYLKTRGVDPKTHPVVGELERIKQYFDKLKNAEDPAKRAVTVDKGAANRFIKHAIAQVKAGRPPGDNEAPTHICLKEDGSAPVPIKVTSKMLEREQYLKDVREAGSEEENDLEVIDDAEEVDYDTESPAPRDDKGKARAKDENDTVAGARKRRRPAVDPFAGYGEEPADETTEPTKRNRASPSQADSKSGAPEAVAQSSTKNKLTKAKKAKRKSSTA